MVSDIVGPIPVTSKGGYKYFVTFLDEYSRYARVFPLAHKNEAFDKFKQYYLELVNEFGSDFKLSHFRSDNGTEFINGQFNTFCQENGIQLEHPAPYTHEQNGLIERFNQTIVYKTSTVLHHSGLNPSYLGRIS